MGIGGPRSSRNLRVAAVPDLIGPRTDGSPESRPPNVNLYKMDSSSLEGETLASREGKG
jgi:hypothetical protein